MAEDKKGTGGREAVRFVMTVAGIGLYTAAAGCPVKTLTGIPCPACGMTRAWLHVLMGDIPGAFAYHPLFWTAPWILWLMYRETMVREDTLGKRMYLQLLLVFAALLLVYMERVWLHPHGPVRVQFAGGWLERAGQYFMNLRGG